MKTLLIQVREVLMMLALDMSVTSLIAQEAPDQSYDLGAKINDITITQGGTVVVATNDGLVGIKPGQEGTLFNFTCKNPVSSRTCSERISATGKIWAQQNATGALLHMIQDSFSQSHTERGACEVTNTGLPVSKVECKPIKSFYAYRLQDSDSHGKSDLWPSYSKNCVNGGIDPVYATALMLWHVENKTKNINEVKADLYKIFGKPGTFGNTAATSGQCFSKHIKIKNSN